MKKLFFGLMVALSVSGMSASTTWTLQNREYKVDTLYHAKIGPGTTQTSLALSGAQTLKVFYITTDLSNDYVDIRVTKGQNKVVGVQVPSVMSKNASREGAQYFAGVNADFFAGSAPCGPCMVDGDPVTMMNNDWVSWYITDQKEPGFGSLGFGGTVSAAGAGHPLSGVNKYRDENQLILFTPYYGANTGTNMYGAEIAVEPVDKRFALNGTVKLKVTGQVATAGSMAIPAGGYVLSGHGTGKAFVETLTPGMEIEVTTSTTLDAGGQITQIAAGLPMILSGGQTLETQGALDHLTALNPRTAIGYSADKKHLVMLVVDGRSTASVGVVSRVLGDMMREVGCSEAMNFDGGGSSTLYTQAFGTRNVPSDGRERAVTNAVWAVATSPTDNEVAEIAFMNPRLTLPRYGYFNPVIYGYNKYGALVNIDLKDFTLSCDEALGQVMNDGSVLFANGTGTHVLKARYGDAEAQIVVTIGSAQPQMRLERLIIDGKRPYKAEVVAEVEGNMMSIDNKALEWESADENIATVDAEGVIKGVSHGVTSVSGTVEELSVSLPVSVEIPVSRYVPVNQGEGVSGWTTSGTSTKNRTVEALGDNSGVTLGYTVSAVRAPSVTLKQKVSLPSLPDSLRLVVNPGEYKVTGVSINAGANGDRGSSIDVADALQPSTDNIIQVAVDKFIDVNDFKSYPMEFTSVTFKSGDAANTECKIQIPRFDAVYTSVDPDQGVDEIGSDVGRDELEVSGAVCERGKDLVLDAGVDAQWSVFAVGGRCMATGRGNIVPTGDFKADMYLVTVVEGVRARVVKLLIK